MPLEPWPTCGDSAPTSDAGVRRAALEGLADLDPAGAGPWLRAAAGDPDAAVRATAVAALAATGALAPLTRPSSKPCGWTPTRLSGPSLRSPWGCPVDTEEAEVVVRPMLSADDPVVRAAGLGALARLPAVDGPAAASLPRRPGAHRARRGAPRLAARTTRDDDAILDACLAALDDPAREVRLAAAGDAA